MKSGFEGYINSVKNASYPDVEHTYKIDDEVMEKIIDAYK